MNLVKVLKYVETSFEGKPSFKLLMSDGKIYISNGCVFIEDTEENRLSLIEKFNCEKYLVELDNSELVGFESVTNTSYMFYGCTNLTSFDSGMSDVTNASYMFYGCTNLTSFDSDMSSVADASGVFYGCTNLTSFNSDISNVTSASYMFRGCTNLTSFNSDISNVTYTSYMFDGCNKLQNNPLQAQ